MNGPADAAVAGLRRIVIVGGGLAGHTAAVTLRQEGHNGDITLLSGEEHLPYDRPPLSKEFLDGTVDSTVLPGDYDALAIDVKLQCPAIALEANAVRSTAGLHPYDGLIIATGSTPVRLPGQSALPHALELRTRADAQALQTALAEAATVTVIGAGWIGAEVATAAAARGSRVTVVDAGPAPLARVLPVEIGRHMSSWYTGAGIDLRLHCAVLHMDARGVVLTGGERLDADVTLVGAGARPDTAWLEGSGLIRSPDGAVVVDSRLRAGRGSIFAAGDIVRWPSLLFSADLRLEHWEHAAASGRTAARNLLGADEPYDPVPYFWSDQLGHQVQYAGHHTAEDTLVFRGRPDVDQPWTALWLRDSRLRAALTVDRPRDLMDARRLVAQQAELQPSLSSDPSQRLNKATIDTGHQPVDNG